MTDTARIIDRIRKLNAMAESARAIGSLAEAEAFAAAVQKTLLAHKLDLSVLEGAGDVIEDIDREDVTLPGQEGKSRRVKWLDSLAHVIAKAHFCRTVACMGTENTVVIGKASDREVVGYLVVTLARTATELAKQAVRTTPGANVRSSFLSGFVVGIWTRLKEGEKVAVEQNRGLALVLQRSEGALTAYMAKLNTKKGRSGHLNARNGAAFDAGRKAGAAAPMHAGVNAGSTRAPLAIGSGR